MSARDKERYYWLKIERGFFDRHDMKVLESMDNGKDYELFYLKLMLESIDHEGYLRFSEKIPYNEKMLAGITNTDVDKVRTAVNVLQELGMIEVLSDKTIYLNEVAKRLGSETYSSARKRDQRELATESEVVALPAENFHQAGDNVPCSAGKCPQELEIELELDKELDIIVSSNEDTRSPRSAEQAVFEAWNALDLQKLVKILPGSERDKQLKKRIKDYGLDKVLEAIERIKKSEFLQGRGKKGWTITFDWFIKPCNFQKVLEGNYDNTGQRKTGHAAVFDPDAIDKISI